ncbi:MAG: BrnT family toxin [Nitrospinota bacterium]
MECEFDAEKSRQNKIKHGIDFKEAQKLWLGKTIELPARQFNEKRSLVIGKIARTYWSAIITRRSSIVRIISVRRSRDEEKEIYENS